MYIPFDPANRAKNETGNVYGYLTVLGIAHKKPGRGFIWECKCVCGQLVQLPGDTLRTGKQTSCGCMRGKATIHGQSRRGASSGAYSSWLAMKQRCNNPNHIHAHNYSERGITYDPRWEDFENFYRDMGDRPAGYTLERINNDKGYGPGNCKWATQKEQANNRRPRKRNK